MSKLGTTFRQGETLKAEKLNLMVNAINDNADELSATTQQATNNANAIAIINGRDIDISESEFEALREAGELDPTKTYYIYEE